MVLITLAALFLLYQQALAQMPATMSIPSPDEIAFYHADQSREVTEMSRNMLKKSRGEYFAGTTREGFMECKQVDEDVRVYSTSLPVDEVRNWYVERMVEHYHDFAADHAKEQGLPPEAVEEFRQVIVYEVVGHLISEVEIEPLAWEDPDVMMGMDLPYDKKWFECYRKLYPQIKDKMSKVFELDLYDNVTGQRAETFSYQGLHVQQPAIDYLDCQLSDKTWIMLTTYHMACTLR